MEERGIMDIFVLIKIIVGLVALLGILIFLLFFMPKKTDKKIKQKQQQSTSDKVEIKKSLAELLAVLKNQNSSAEALALATDVIVQEYGVIPAKFGARINPEFYAYAEMIIRLCRHKNTNKDLVFNFYKALLKKNPAYAREIEDALTKGLNSRGA